jgi:thermitase
VLKRVAAVFSTAGFLAVALFAGNVVDFNGVAGSESLSIQSTVTPEPLTTQETGVMESSTSTAMGSTGEPAALAGRWGIERIGVAEAWAAAGEFAPVTVAVLDTGISTDAPFADRITGNIDFTGEGLQDEHGHGTHMAGTIAAIAPNARILNIKVADSRGRCETRDVAAGIRWAIGRGAQVINISLEVAPSAELEDAVNHAWTRGAVVVVAAGNSGSSTPAYPAAYVEALAVAGSNESDGLAVLSNHGDWVDVTAPGYKIYAEFPGSEFGYETGTSPAASHVSGVAALLYGIADDASANGLLNDEVRNAIQSTAQPLATGGTGSGLVDAAAALASMVN